MLPPRAFSNARTPTSRTGPAMESHGHASIAAEERGQSVAAHVTPQHTKSDEAENLVGCQHGGAAFLGRILICSLFILLGKLELSVLCDSWVSLSLFSRTMTGSPIHDQFNQMYPVRFGRS